VNKLLSFGDISVLAPTVEQSIFYGRDRKEPGTEQKQISYDDYLPKSGNFGVDYIYLFDEYIEEWSCYNIQGDLVEIPTDDLDIIR
jgi:hypothetical protein